MNENAIRDAMTTGYKFSTYSTENQIRDVVRWKINDAIRLRGQGGMDSSMEETTVSKVTEVIMRDYLSMTDKEFGLVLEMGVSGEFGRDTWVNGGMILQWLRSYKTNAQHVAIIDEQDEEARSKHRLTKGEIDELNEQAYDDSIHSGYEFFKEHGTIFGDDERAFHMPQWASMVYRHYREKGIIPEPTAQRELEANQYADRKVVEYSTKKVYIPAAHEDWIDSYLLKKYYEDIKNKRL